MSAATPEPMDWAAIDLQPGAELILGWRPKADHLDAGRVTLSTDVARTLRELASVTLARLPTLRRRAYGGAPYLEPGEEYLAVPPGSLAGAGSEAPVAVQTDPEESALLSELLQLIVGTVATSLTTPDLTIGRYLFYAVVCRSIATSNRIGFVRQIDPHKVTKPGGLLAMFGDDALHEVSGPLFVFDTAFDLVVTAEEIAVLRLEAFHRLFADIGLLTQAAPTNARAICESVGNVTEAAVAALGAAAASRRSLARRLARLSRPGAMPAVTPSALRRAMRKHGLDPRTLITGGTIDFDQGAAVVFVDLLDQIYFETDFTNEHRRADRFSRL